LLNYLGYISRYRCGKLAISFVLWVYGSLGATKNLHARLRRAFFIAPFHACSHFSISARQVFTEVNTSLLLGTGQLTETGLSRTTDTILWMEGLWVRTSVKLKITKEEKRLIGRPSSPRWEIDVVAYSGRDNVLYAVECKSYLDSRGVRLCGFDGTDPRTAERYKLFCDNPLREAVFSRLKSQFAASGARPMHGCSSA
jgi:hypothetical protein